MSDAPLVVLRREYLEALWQECDRLGKDVGKRVLCCAAKLMDYWLHWRGWKLKRQRTDWIYQPLKAIYQDLMGEHSLHVIRDALDLLRELGLLNRRNNPGNAQDRTYQYQVAIDSFNELLGVGEFTSEDAEFRSESPRFTVEKSDRSQLPTITIESNKTTQFVENERERSGSEVPKTGEKAATQTAQTATNPDPAPVDPETFRTILAEAREAGAENSQQFQGFVRKKIRELGAAAVDRFRRGIQAMKEQKTLKNPTGYLVAAVERGFTPNAEKAKPTTQAAMNRSSDPEPLPASDPSRSPIPCPNHKPPIDLNREMEVVEAARKQGDIEFLKERLETLWREGDDNVREKLRAMYPRAEKDSSGFWLDKAGVVQVVSAARHGTTT